MHMPLFDHYELRSKYRALRITKSGIAQQKSEKKWEQKGRKKR